MNNEDPKNYGYQEENFDGAMSSDDGPINATDTDNNTENQNIEYGYDENNFDGAMSSDDGAVNSTPITNENLEAKNPYEILGIDSNASLDEIRKARRILTQKYHPDIAGKDTTSEMQIINDAFDQIKQDKKINPDMGYQRGNFDGANTSDDGPINAEPFNHGHTYPNYKGYKPVTKFEITEEQKKLMEYAEKKKTINYIPGTSIPFPRKKKDDEGIEEYEVYLKNHYRPYLQDIDKIEYYEGTNIIKPRGKYPHEVLDSYVNIEPDYQKVLDYYDEMLSYYAKKYDNRLALPPAKEVNKDYTGPVKEGQQLAVQTPKDLTVQGPKDLVVKENEHIDKNTEQAHKVTGIRKATDFLKRHKKGLLITAGLVSLTAIFAFPPVTQAIMYANSVLWQNFSAVPAFQSFLHGCNVALSQGLGTSATFAAGSGVWTTAAGTAINATAASGSLLGALTTSLATLGGLGLVTVGIKNAVQLIINKIKNREKNNKNDKENEVVETKEEEKIETTEVEKDNKKDLDKQKDDNTQNNQKTNPKEYLKEFKNKLDDYVKNNIELGELKTEEKSGGKSK